jgi:2-hydroxy-6-oxonona-2,4-dienedioate hydrolase
MIFELFRWWGHRTLERSGGTHGRREIGDVDLVVHRFGPPDGDPWLLLHGMAGTTATTWAPVVKALGRECRMISPELSSIGGTRAPGGAVDLDTAPDLLAELVETELGEGPVTVAGVSLGAWMAVLLARERPDLVGRLVLADAAGFLDQDWERIERQVTLESPDQTQELLEALYHRIPWSLRLARRGFYQAYTSEAVSCILATTSEAHAYTDEELAAIRAPALILWGDSDRLFYPEVGEALARAIPDARYQVIDHCGHALHWECPKEFAAAITRFHRTTTLRPRTPEETP